MADRKPKNSFGARATFNTGSGTAYYYRLAQLQEQGAVKDISRLPYSIRVLLENVLRNEDGFVVTDEDVRGLAQWNAKSPAAREIPFKPARVILQDFTGVACLVDIAAMRDAMHDLNGNVEKIQPLIPVDLVIDHSVQVDYFGTQDALKLNAAREMDRNRERYEFMRWGQNALKNFRVVPPSTGIVHQVNLEYLAKGVLTRPEEDSNVAFPDSLVGTDSHTTMINGLGVLGWGVGGIEAEACMLGQPIYILTPEVIGVKLTGKLRDGVTATDLALTVTQMLRKKGVVDKFVEFYGSGLSQMSLPDRATIANMAPEYGATMGFFPVDHETLDYLRRTGRTDQEVKLVEEYYKAQGMFRTDGSPDPEYTDTLSLDLSTVEASLAGPKRPQDRVLLKDMQQSFQTSLRAPIKDRGFELKEGEIASKAVVKTDASGTEIAHGAVVIAAITSCTNTSNPSVMLGAGLLAKKAVARGLKVKPYVKTSMAPGSRVVTEYLKDAGLLDDLERLGFNVVGYGCTTCIGNSGLLPAAVDSAIKEGNIVASAVLSGNRNFEGRIYPSVKANYLASPPLVVAYALAGTTDIDLIHDPLGYDENGKPVYLRDLWPTQEEIAETIRKTSKPEVFRRLYDNVGQRNEDWNAIQGGSGTIYQWSDQSTYVHKPPFFDKMPRVARELSNITEARVLGLFGDSITTDHISPAGSIRRDSPAGKYLLERGVEEKDFNQYGTRRGNDEVMLRGTFANPRLKNLIVRDEQGNPVEGISTIHYPSRELMTIYDAAMRYKTEGTPLVILAGKEYGTGSSRDWAAKGTALMGVKAVLAESFERIHRSNLVGMGVLPLQFKNGENAESLGLSGEDVISIEGIGNNMQPRQDVTVKVKKADGKEFNFAVTARLDTPVEIEYYANGGILPTVLRSLLNEQ